MIYSQEDSARHTACSKAREDAADSGMDVSRGEASAVAAAAYPRVDEGRRSQQWVQKSGVDVDHRPLWGTFIKACVSPDAWQSISYLPSFLLGV